MDGAAVSPGPENPGDFETNRKKEKKRREAYRESESRNVVKLERLEGGRDRIRVRLLER